MMTEIAMQVAAHIRYLREAKDWSQSDLATAVGTTQPVVSRWESGNRELTVGKIFILAEALQVLPSTLLCPPPTAD